MSGHSKWATIKRKKGAADAKRGQLFSKLSRAIIVAAKEGGGDPESNAALREPSRRRATTRCRRTTSSVRSSAGAGGGEGDAYESMLYEGYAPGGVAVICTILTDNRNRTASDLRFIFTKNGGSLGTPGSVAWQFDRKGVVLVDREGVDEDELMEVALAGGAEDVAEDGAQWQITTEPADFMAACARPWRRRASATSRPSSRWSPRPPSSPPRRRRGRSCGWSTSSRTTTTCRSLRQLRHLRGGAGGGRGLGRSGRVERRSPRSRPVGVVVPGVASPRRSSASTPAWPRPATRCSRRLGLAGAGARGRDGRAPRPAPPHSERLRAIHDAIAARCAPTPSAARRSSRGSSTR